AYASTPSINPTPAVINDTPSTSAVPITATIRSILSSRARVCCTWSPTGAPQAGQRPAGLRTSGAAQCGQSITDAIGTRGLWRMDPKKEAAGWGGVTLPPERGSLRFGVRSVLTARSTELRLLGAR